MDEINASQFWYENLNGNDHKVVLYQPLDMLLLDSVASYAMLAA
jgi:hypothetical protein